MFKSKIALATIVLFVATSIVIISCNKNPKTAPLTQSDNANSQLPKNEINFAPKDRTEAGKLAINFLKQTKYSPVKQTRDGGPTSYPTHMAAWLFEAGANFLENDNNVKRNTTTTTIIELPRLSNGEISATELINSFNLFIAVIEGNTATVPKLINVTIDDELASSMHIKVDVDYGDAPAGQIVFPTNNMNYDLAANWLSNAFSTEMANLPLGNPPPGSAWACDGFGFFWYNVVIVTPLCYHFPELAELPDPWLWTAQVANGNPNDPIFKVADFPIYYNKMVAVANDYNSYINPWWGNGKKVISINLEGKQVVSNNHPLNCQGAGNIINGYVHTLSSIAMADLGCMPYPN